MTDELFDASLCLEQVRRRDEDAARDLVEQLYPLVIRIVRGHLPRRTAEEDLAQEVFLRLFARLDQYEPRSGVPFEHWVSRLAVRTCLDALCTEQRRPEWRLSDLDTAEAAWVEHLTAEAAAPDTAPAAAREAIELMLSWLSPAYPWVIRLLDLEGKSVQEISQLTGWSKTGSRSVPFAPAPGSNTSPGATVTSCGWTSANTSLRLTTPSCWKSSPAKSRKTTSWPWRASSSPPAKGFSMKNVPAAGSRATTCCR
jgi:RNA polymerase sigma-70 factor (ECF subfamily)